jgi:uncharacterized protein YggU (UPF0235/DUF167 family)
VAGLRDGALLIRLTTAPVDGAANDALARCLAAWLDLPKRAVTIVSGERARQKRVRIAGGRASAVVARLAAASRR